MEVIRSLTNDLVKDWVRLSKKKERDNKGVYLVEGEHLVKEAIEANLVECVIAVDSYFIDTDKKIYYVTKEVMKKISNLFTPPVVMAVVRKKMSLEIIGNTLVLDGIQDPGNLGTMIRSAVAFNFNNIILGEGTVDIYNEKVIRATEGMIFKINIINMEVKKSIRLLQEKGYTVYGTSVKKGSVLDTVEGQENIAILIVNEGSGISDEVLNLCDSYIYIPMKRKCESLNAGVAASIIMYELGRK